MLLFGYLKQSKLNNNHYINKYNNLKLNKNLINLKQVFLVHQHQTPGKS